MGPKKKRKSKKQQKEEDLLAERQKREEAEEKARQEEIRLKELEKQKMEAKLKSKKEQLEHEIRQTILNETCKIFKLAKKHDYNLKISLRRAEEWERYLNCNRLPYPDSASSMHTYLHLWKNQEEKNLHDSMKKAEIVLEVLDILNKVIEEPLDVCPQTTINRKRIRNDYRYELLRKIDIGCFYLLRNIKENMNRIDFYTVDYKISSENIKMSMWGWLKEPVSEADKRAPPCVNFPEIGALVRLPVPYNKVLVVLRVIHTKFDHHSDNSASFNEPNATLNYKLLDSAIRLYEEKEELKQERDTREKEIEEKERQDAVSPIPTECSQSMTNISEDEKEIEEVEELRPITPIPEIITCKLPKRNFDETLNIYDNESCKVLEDVDNKIIEKSVGEVNFKKYLNFLCPREIPGVRSIQELILAKSCKQTKELPKHNLAPNALKRINKLFDIPKEEKENQSSSMDLSLILNELEEERWRDYKRTLDTKVSQFELNLRKYSILGGVFYIDLIKHVPQEYKLKDGSTIHVSLGDFNITREEFEFIYVQPKVTETENEEEEKPPQDDNIDKLIYVEISLAQHVLWFEAPTVVLWREKEKIWSSEHVYDIKFNEEKQLIMCKIGRCDPLALATVRFNNLPFQTWELRPDWNDRSLILFSITASTVIVEFLIKGNKVALHSLQNATTTALEPIVGEYYYPNQLIDLMIKGGVDIFPCNDTFLYVEGHCAKCPILEDHTYLCMAMYCNVYQFTWSRWNMSASKNMLVYQMREALSKQNLPSYYMVMTTVYRTAIVECSEVSPSFSEKSINENEFHPDLYCLLSHVTTAKAIQELGKLDITFIMTIYEMISKTKFISFS